MSHTRKCAAGFSLIEIMVSLVVICIGLLGIAKLQALALSNTSTSRLRSLAAIQAASLAAAMHSNRQYWGTVITQVQLKDGALTSPEPALSGAGISTIPAAANQCFAQQCTPAALAAFDLARWTQSLSAVLPNPFAFINCPPPNAGGAPVPPSCTILIRWTETGVALQRQELGAAGNAQFQTPDYTLYVEP